MQPPNDKTIESLQIQVDNFNNAFPVGTKIEIRRPGNTKTLTVKEPASILGGHTAVGWFEEISGCYALDKVFQHFIDCLNNSTPTI